MANSTTSIPRWIEPSASAIGLPCSRVTISAKSCLSRLRISRNRRRYRARWAGATAAHAGKAFLAASTAAMTVGSPAKLSFECARPVAGHTTSMSTPVRSSAPLTMDPETDSSSITSNNLRPLGLDLRSPAGNRFRGEMVGRRIALAQSQILKLFRSSEAGSIALWFQVHACIFTAYGTDRFSQRQFCL